MKKILFPLILCCSLTSVFAVDLNSSLQALRSEDAVARDAGQSALQAALNAATAPTAAADLEMLEAAVIQQLSDSHDRMERLYLMRLLGLYGREASVAPLYPLLGDADARVRDGARRALASIGTAQAQEHLIVGFLRGPAEDRIGYIDTLVYLGDGSVAPVIAEALSDSDEQVVQSAAMALGKLGNRAVIPALESARRGAVGDVKLALELGLLDLGVDADLAYQLVGHGSHETVRVAAFEQLLLQDPVRANQVLHGVFAKSDVVGRSLFLTKALALGSAATRSAIIEHMKTASDVDRLLIVAAIGNHQIEGYESEMLALMPEAEGLLRDNLISTLGTVGGDESFEVLYEVFKANARDANAANALARLKAPSADAKALKTVEEGADLDSRIAALKVLELRNASGATAAVNRLISQPGDPKIRGAAMKAGESIGDLETVKLLTEMILNSGELTRPAQLSLKRLSIHLNAGDFLWDRIYLPALTAAQNDAGRENLIMVLDGSDSPKALQYLKQQVLGHGALSQAALKTLARWPSFQVGELWIEIAEDAAASASDLKAAEKGIVRVITSNQIEAKPKQKVQFAVKAVERGQTVDFKLGILSGAFDQPQGNQKGAMKQVLKSLLDDPDVGEKVKALLASL